MSLTWGAILAVACRPPSVPDGPGTQLAERLECARCHDAPDLLTPEPRERDCVGCHQAIFAGAFDSTHTEAGVARWKRNVQSLRYAPSLQGGSRLQSSWVTAFLAEPHEVRPLLPAQMPRLPLTDTERTLLASWLSAAPPDPEPWTGGHVDEGLRLLAERGCGGCHAFTGAAADLSTPSHPPAEAAILAPDLRHVRERMAPSTVRAWLADPAALQPDTRMPTPDLSATERDDVAAALLRAPLAPEGLPPAPERLPPLRRPVSYAEVEAAVFHKVCWHCHADPAGNHGDGGPGNTGGLGYAGVGLELGTREGILRGMGLSDGQTRSVLDGDPPLLVEVMLRRHRELRGEWVERPGMPLGLPPLSAAQIQLVESWIQQGTPP